MTRSPAPEVVLPATVEAAPATAVTTTTTTTATTTTLPPTTTTTVAPTTAPPAPAQRFTMEPYTGFGMWVDTYDWTAALSTNPITVADIDVMAAEGTQTLFIQTNRWDNPADQMEPERLIPLIDRAHARGMHVVAWYLPTLVDVHTDLRRMVAMSQLDVDGIAVDIEARDVADVAERNRRLIQLSAALREALPSETIGAIVMEPVIMEDVNPNYWPGYPWAEMAPYYDVWLPMSYWTNRRDNWRDAYTYTAVNIARVRERIGQPDAPVHTIGGIGDRTTDMDLHGMVTAAVEHSAIGGSLYDYRTAQPGHWPILRAFQR